MRSICFCLILIVMYSCNNVQNRNQSKSVESKSTESKESSAIIGKWKLEEIDYSQFLSEQSDEVRSAFEDEMKSAFEKLRNRTFFEFKEDRVLKIEEPDETCKQSVNFAKWKVNEKSDSLVLQFEQDEKYKILTLNATDLVISTDESPKRILYFSRLF